MANLPSDDLEDLGSYLRIDQPTYDASSSNLRIGYDGSRGGGGGYNILK